MTVWYTAGNRRDYLIMWQLLYILGHIVVVLKRNKVTLTGRSEGSLSGYVLWYIWKSISGVLYVNMYYNMFKIINVRCRCFQQCWLWLWWCCRDQIQLMYGLCVPIKRAPIFWYCLTMCFCTPLWFIHQYYTKNILGGKVDFQVRYSH